MVLAAKGIMAENLKGIEALQELKNNNKFTNSSISRIENATLELRDKSQNIDNILETINSIADQTNLLALNASIEAARAGEAGKGFAVVANEIRNLAEGSRKSTEQIRTIVEQIQGQSQATAEIMLEVKDNSQEQTKSVEDVNSSFNHISGSMDGMSRKIEALSQFMHDMEKIINGIAASIENISSVS
ncbi:MAG: methyl-accepting chemotaxis protein [Peptococcaceae bacterium]